MRDIGSKNSRKNTPRWESELWSCLSRGDGIHCPQYPSCQSRRNGVQCLCDHEDYYEEMNGFLDNDRPGSWDQPGITFEPSSCPKNGGIFQLVNRLAHSIAEPAEVARPPIPSDLITHADDNLPIEVRRVPLKAYRGAIWHLSDCWVVHLNSNDKPARQRFTLYHEIFHILAHCKATPVFKKSAESRPGFFNEMLADHFAAVILMPARLVKGVWPGVKDIQKMAFLFEVPDTVMWFGLKYLHLI